MKKNDYKFNKKASKLLFLIVITLFLVNCTTNFDNNTSLFRCSLDTISFDTLLVNQKSETRIFKIYNDGQSILTIDSISLQNQDSCFVVNVNGSGLQKPKINLLSPNDSLFIFVIAKPRSSFVYNPNIKLGITIYSKSKTNFIPFKINVLDFEKLSGFLDGIKNLDVNKSYLIADSFVINENAVLTIQENCRLFFKKNAYLKVKGSILASGSLHKPIIFQGIRLTKDYSDVPGQWYGIILNGNQKTCFFQYCEIKNSIIGLNISNNENPVQLSNCIIQHNNYSNLNILNSKLNIFNCVFGDCGSYSLFATGINSIQIVNSTFANYWSNYSGHGIRNTPSIYFENSINSILYIGNTIVYGNRNEGEFSIDKFDIGNLKFENSLFKVNDQTKFSKTAQNCIFNPKFKFKLPSELNYNYSLDTLSVAKDAGSIKILSQNNLILDKDILGNSRIKDKSPDIGAYEREK